MRKTKRFKEDARYRVANREALIGLVLVMINFALWFGFAYGLGSKPVEEYSYIWGLPAWFFYSCIASTVLVVVLVMLAVKFLYKEVSFEEEDEE
ncbi:YhdT family protein [Halobacillus halophilus]|uniref:YhdT family protein n=1 Tax=Halobacillus halophilus TaxID=1570 RepID=UPI001CD20A20|nr:YhdT family protein [Halobacillus halophilus]MCA1009149.1 YhdT family protein [Halobacillus halophilus]